MGDHLKKISWKSVHGAPNDSMFKRKLQCATSSKWNSKLISFNPVRPIIGGATSEVSRNSSQMVGNASLFSKYTLALKIQIFQKKFTKGCVTSQLFFFRFCSCKKGKFREIKIHPPKMEGRFRNLLRGASAGVLSGQHFFKGGPWSITIIMSMV